HAARDRALTSWGHLPLAGESAGNASPTTTASQSSFMRATYAQPFPRSPVAISANRNSDDEAGLLDRRKFACRSEHRAAVDLALLDASEQHTDVVAGPRLVDRLTEDLDAVDTRIEGAVDLHGVADPQRATFHPAGRDDAAVADHE